MQDLRQECVLIAAGGTGGHVIPGIEVARKLRERGWRCVFVGTERGFENRLVPEAGFPLVHLSAGALKSVSWAGRLRTLVGAPGALATAVGLVTRTAPGAALSLGGYAAGPLVAACALLDVPLVVLEPNALPGLANRLAAPAARRALLGHRRAAAFFRPASCAVTGMPVRSEFFRVRPKPPGEPFTVLILGGSQGAARLNRAAVGAARRWTEGGGQLPTIIHQTGERELSKVASAYRSLGVRARTSAYFDGISGAFARSDLVICRAGASVIAELCAARRPAILVPFPHAADDHQRANGARLEAAGGALVVDDRKWDADRMVREVELLRADPARLRHMSAALEPLAPASAAASAADAVEEAAQRAGRIR